MTLRLRGVRRAVVVAPHPDDEVIGAAALIQALKRQGTRVTVVIVSDGAASHPASRRWPPKRLMAARRRESLKALRRLSVSSGDVRFLGLADGALSGQAVQCRYRLRRSIGALAAVDLLVGPAAGDAHPDHRAVAAALAALAKGARQLTYQIWPPRPAHAGRTRSITMPAGHAAKRSLIRLHRTQLGAITDDPTGFAIARHELAAFSHPIEMFTEVRR